MFYICCFYLVSSTISISVDDGVFNGDTMSTMSATSGAGTDYPEIIFIFRLCSNCSIVSFLCCVFVPLYVFSIGHCFFSVFRLTTSSYPLSIFKLVLSTDGRHCYGCKTTLPFQPSFCIRIKQTSYRD